MTSKEIIELFIAAVEKEPHTAVIEKYYAKDASIQENQSEPVVGVENLIKREKEMLDKAISVESECLRPYFHIDEKVVIRWKFKFTWKDYSVTEIEEIAYQIWKEDQIFKERFFYDPKQFTPVKKSFLLAQNRGNQKASK